MNFNTHILNQAHCQAMDNSDDGRYSSDKEHDLLLLLAIMKWEEEQHGVA